MKTAMKILLAPIMGLTWLAIKAGAFITYISGLALGVISAMVAIIGIVYLFVEGIEKGFIGLVLAYLLSPYGIPMFAIMILGAIQRIRENLKRSIYG